MRTALATVIALLVLAAPARAERQVCDRRPGITIVATTHWRVFQRIHIGYDLDKDRVTIFSCRTDSRKPEHRLERSHNVVDDSVEPDSGQLSGRWLLLEDEVVSDGDVGHSLRLFDLRRGRLQARVYAHGEDPFPYALTRSGAFAARIPSPGAVVAFDADGRRRLAGPGARDVAAARRRVYWTEAGLSASAELGAAPRGDLGRFG